MFQTKVVDKTKTHILCSIIVSEKSGGYEIMWKNMVEPDRQQMTIWRMRIGYWVTKLTDTHTHTHTHTHSEHLMHVAFPRQQWLRARPFNVTFVRTLPVFFVFNCI